MVRKINEECAVFAVNTDINESAGITYNALLTMQHRGQEGSGIAVLDNNSIFVLKNKGLVGEVFTNKSLDTIPKSNIAIGHNRYSTTGGNAVENVQPFVTEYLTGRLATVHNGNITNAKKLRDMLMTKGIRFESTSDSEVISALIAYHIVQIGNDEEGIKKSVNMLEGSFCLIILCGDGKLIAVRDADGYRPFCIGRNESGIALASESCALESCGFEFSRDILPGEMLVVKDRVHESSTIAINRNRELNSGLCIFEYVYFSRTDSVIDGLSVYEARYNMGKILAKEHYIDADVVCGVPDSGLEAAIGYSSESSIPLVSGFVKNRYIGRSFIYPTQEQRKNAVRLKLNPLKVNIEGKRVVVVDDSIVRGTTSAKIVKLLKDAGAKEVHMRISSPPFRYSCHYGTDIDDEEKLIANNITTEMIAKEIGADSLGYISLKGLKQACVKCKLPFCTKCFAGSEEE